MELEDIKCYVKKYSEAYLPLSSIKSLSWMYIFLGLIPFGYGIITRKFIVASIIVVMVICYTITLSVLERKITSVSYYQRFILSGSSSLYMSLFFLIMAYCLVETIISDKHTQIIYSFVLGFAWILAVLFIFSFKIYNIKKGIYRKTKEGQQHKLKIAISSAVGAVFGISIMKFVSKWMSQEVALDISIIFFYIVSVLAALGIPHLLIAYFVKKYSILGESLPVIRTIRKKVSARKRKWIKILIMFLVIIVFAITVMTILGGLVNKGILK